jgi:phosphomannomutase
MNGGGTLVVGVSGVRGIVGNGLSPEVAARFAAAMGSFCRGGPVVIGRDTRPSGAMFRHAVISGLLATGCEVIDLGVCPTPSVQLAVRSHGAAGGVIITASHNPVEYNGLKFVSPRGIFLTEEEGTAVRSLYQSGTFDYVGNQPAPAVQDDRKAVARHVSAILALSVLDVSRIQARKFKVVLDPGNGTGAMVGGPLLDALGCQTVLLHGEPTGVFSRGPEPVAENLEELCKTVVGEGADVGFATDPDGDRLSIVTNTGVAIGEEFSMVLGADLVLSRTGGGTVVTNLSTSRMVDRVADRWGGRVVRTPVGEVHVSLRMIAEKAVVGGEGNGGVILPEAHLGRDAAVGMALVLELLSDRQCSISEAWESIPHFSMIKTKAPVDEQLGERLSTVLAPLAEGGQVEQSDGVKISWDDGWLHIRSSNTEPIVRVVAEAESPSRAESLVKDALRLLGQKRT